MKRNTSKKFSTTEKKEPNAKVRLNKFISNAGVCSRREADKLIQDGKVKVNNQVITELGYQINPDDLVFVDGKRLVPEKLTYVLLNKPRGYITTTKDEKDRDTVMDLVKNATRERLYPVGRLDRNTSGVLLLTNDGELTNALIHPSASIPKVYAATLNKALSREDFQKILTGIELEDGMMQVDDIAYTDAKDLSKVGIEIHSGKNRVIRRLFEALGYEVERLDRVMFGILTKKDLPRGKWRFLSEKEVNLLRAKVTSRNKGGKPQ